MSTDNMRLSTVKITNVSPISSAVIAAAARISTQEGDAFTILKNSIGKGVDYNSDKNLSLIEKVIGSGHETILEHVSVTLAFNNVSVFTEQFFIEHRLISPTIKSRRYVDFTHQGYYIPDELEGSELEQYVSYMERMFEIYNELLESGVAKEDARFFLPYSFHSNFYLSCNIRELLHIIKDMLFGKYANNEELKNLAHQIIDKLDNLQIIPSKILTDIKKTEVSDRNIDEDDIRPETSLTYYKRCVSPLSGDCIVELVGRPSNTSELIRYGNSIIDPYGTPHTTSKIPDRILEQLNYSFRIRGISLACLTHFCRHRIQSIIIPPLNTIKYNTFIIPPTLSIRNDSNPNAQLYYERYNEAFNLLLEALKNPILFKYRQYFALSGNTIDIMTTMNARELRHFIALRTCNRSQWEIQHIASKMLFILRREEPNIFNYFGPSCYVNDTCPEGKMCCGKMDAVKKIFSPNGNYDINIRRGLIHEYQSCV